MSNEVIASLMDMVTKLSTKVSNLEQEREEWRDRALIAEGSLQRLAFLADSQGE